MSIFRKFTRKQEKIQSKDKHMTPRDLVVKVGMSLFMLSYAVMPKVAEAEENGLPSVNTTFTQGGTNVTDIYAQKVFSDTVAVNRFENFNVGEKTIANMHFKEENGTTVASNLFNFVKNDININGTVNAIRNIDGNSKVGGNIYFLSPKNIVVGSQGIINAGAVTLMSGGPFPGSADKAKDYASDIQQGKYLLTDNETGSVTINGTINATDYISIGSSKSIFVQKAQDAANAPKLYTNRTVDFKDLVNIKDASGSVVVDSGLGNNLELTRTDGSNGNIMLAARSEKVNANSPAIQGWLDISGYNTVKSEIIVGTGSEINSVGGDVSIGATSVRKHNSFGDLTIFGDIGGAEASVSVDGTVQGSSVSITADVTNQYKKSVYEKAVTPLTNKAKQELFELLGDIGNINPVFIGSKSSSSITIGQNADIKASIGKVDISSNSNVSIKANGSTNSGGTETGLNYFDAGFVYAYIDNDASITVDSGAKIESSTNSVSIESSASTLEIISATATKDEKSTAADKISAALFVGLGKTSSHVDIKENSSIRAGTDITVGGTTYLGAYNNAFVFNNDATYVSAAVQVNTMDTESIVNVNGNLNAGMNVDDHYKGITIYASDDNAINTGADNYVSEVTYPKAWIDYYTDVATLTQYAMKKSVEGLEKYFPFLFDNADNAGQGGNAAAKKGDKDIADTLFSLGTSINVVSSSHEATVNVGEKANLNSRGKMSISATRNTSDLNMIARGGSSAQNGTKEEGKDPTGGATINGSLSIAKLDNSANVNIGIKYNDSNNDSNNDTSDSHAILKSGDDLYLTAESKYEWDRKKNMVEFLKSCWEDLRKAAYDEGYGDLFGNLGLEKVDAAIKAYDLNPTAENFAAIQKAVSESDAGSKADQVFKTFPKVASNFNLLYNAVFSFLDATSYVNMNVGSVAKAGQQQGHVDTAYDIAGSLAISNINNRSRVFVGKNSELTAANDLVAKANASQIDANYYGALQGVASFLSERNKYFELAYPIMAQFHFDLNVLPAWNTGKNVVGGTIGVDNNSIQSSVVVSEGAKLTGAKVDLESDTNLKKILVNPGGGKAKNFGYNGMFSILDYNTGSLVLVDDEATITASGKDGVILNANNDDLIVNVVGDLTGGSSAVGVAAEYVENNVNTIAAVVDIDKDSNSGEKAKYAVRSDADEVTNLGTLVDKFLTNKQKAMLGTSAVNLHNLTDGAPCITTPSLNITSTSSPKIWDFAVAGVIKSETPQPQPPQPQPPQANLINAAEDLLNVQDLEHQNNQDPLNNVGANNNEVSGTTVLGAGAVAIEKIYGATASLLENNIVKMVNATDANRGIGLKAEDTALVVGIAGAFAVNKNVTAPATGTYMLGGTSAYNILNKDTISQIKNANIINAAAISNYAHKEDTVASIAAPLAIDVSDGARGFGAALNLSVNKVDNDVHANMVDNQVKIISENDEEATSVQNTAYDNSSQGTGAANVNVGKETIGLGINAVWAELNNDVKAKVQGGQYKNISNFDNNAATKLTQVSLAAGVGLSSGESAKGNGGAVWTHGKIKNDVSASIIGSADSPISIEGAYLTNRAFDGKVGDGGTTTNEWRKYLTDAGIDITGADTEKNLSKTNLVADVDTDKLDENVALAENADYTKGLPSGGNTKVYTNKQLSFDTNKGNKIYTGAIEFAGTSAENSRATLGVAVSDNTLDNDYKAEISNATITLSHDNGADILAKSDSYVADFAVGVAADVAAEGGSIVSGAGSAAVATLDNDTIATVSKTTINSAKTSVKADTTTEAVSVAGSIGFSDSKVGIGLAFAINQLDNETKAAIYGGTLSGYNSGITAIDVIANSKSTATAVGTGLGFGVDGKVTVQGNVTVNTGKNDTIAEIEQSGSGESAVNNTITNASSIQVKATDNNTLKSAAAGLNLSGNTANVGIGFAVNALNEQKLAARLNNATITSAANGSDIDVKTNETTKLTTIGAGIGFSGGDSKGSGVGYGAITLTKNKENIAEVKNTVQTDTNKKSDILVEAKANNKIVSTADAINVNTASDTTLNAGFAGSGVDLKSDVKANVENSTLNAMDVYVHADSEDKIYNVAIGGVGTNSSLADIANSTSVNKLNNDVKASIINSTVKASNGVGVVAHSNDVLTNLAGGLSVGWKSYVGLGLSVATNDILGDTVATVSGSTIEAQGTGSKTYKNHEFTTDAEKNKMTISEKEHKGLVVDAYSNHDISNVALTAGALLGADGSFVLTGVGSSNKLNGKTEALVNNTDVNKGTENKGNVAVTAVEYTDINDVAINVNVGISEVTSVNVGGSVSVGTLNRTINAKITDDKATSSQDRKVVNADKLIVEAGAQDDIDLVTLGISVGGTAQEAVGVAALVDSLSSTYKVNSEISNINSVNSGLTFLTAHDGRLNYKGVGITTSVGGSVFAAGLGATVGVMKDNNTLTGTVRNAKLLHDVDSADDELSVTNYSEATPDIVSVVASISGEGAGTVGVTVDNHTKNDNLKLEVVNSDLGSADKFAKEAKFKVDNYYKVDKASINVSLAAALYSGGIGVLAQPIHLNSGNVLNITDSNIFADKLFINDKENRNINITAVNATASLIAGIGVTRNYLGMGTILNDVYGTNANDEESNRKSSENLQALLDTNNNAISQAENIINKGVNISIGKLNANKNKIPVSTPATDTGNTPNTFLIKDISASVDTGHRASRGEAPVANAENSARVDGQAIVVSGSNLTGKDITIDSEVKDNVKLVSGTGGFAALDVNVNASRIDEDIKNNININGGSINAENVSVLNHVTGETYAHTIIAQVAIFGVNVGYADVYATGETGITIENETINTTDSLLVRSLHDSVYKTRVEGGTGAGASGSYIEAESSDGLSNTITVKDNVIGNNAKRTQDSASLNTTDINAIKGVTGAMEIAAIKTSKALTETKYGSVNGFGIGCNSSTASINGNSSITLNNNIIRDSLYNVEGSPFGEGITLDTYALFTSIADVDMVYGNGSLLIGGGGVAGHAKNKGGAVISATGNDFDLAAVNAKAVSGGDKELAKVNADAKNISVGIGIGKNKVDASVTTTTATDFTNNKFAAKETSVIKDVEYVADNNGKFNPFYTYKTSYVGKTDVNLDAETNALAHAVIFGTTVGGAIAVGHNGTETNTKETTRVTMDNSGLQDDSQTIDIDESRTLLNSLNMQTVGCNDVYNYADGRGGGIVGISPDAADADNTSEIITAANIKGKYDITGKANVMAAQKDLLTVCTYSTTNGFIIVSVGGSSGSNNRTAPSKTEINIDNAEINADSASFIAYNDIKFNSYKKNSDNSLADAHIYACDGDTSNFFASETNLEFTNVINENASVNINASTVQTKDDITIGAGTTANIFAAEAGAATSFNGAGLDVKLDNTYSYSNKINISGNSSLKTTTAAGDIILDAVDDTVVQAGTYANAAMGDFATSPRVTTINNITRTNEINIGTKDNASDHSKIDSSQDVKLYAGRYDGVALAGLQAIIDAQTYSGSFLIPAHDRNLKNSITENNLVNINKGTLVKSVADTDIYADEGVMSIKVHNFGASLYSSDDPQKEGASYVRTDSSKGSAGDVSLRQNNKVVIDGDVIAGNNHRLDLVIGAPGSADGSKGPEFVVLDNDSFDLRTPFKDSNPDLNVVAKPTITVNGSTNISKDVFDVSKIGYDTINVAASLTEQHKVLCERLKEYSSDPTSPAYISIKASIAQLEARLAEMGMLYKDKDGQNVVLSNIKADVISLPDISVSGGNVTISSANVSSAGGSIKAYGTPQASITNNTNLYLQLGNVNVGEKGGIVKINKTNLTFDTAKTDEQNAAALNSVINEINTQKGIANFGAMHGEAGQNGNLVISNNYNGLKEYTVNVTHEGTTTPTVVKIMPDIELPNGKSITNLGGNATINNNKGNILINGILRANDIFLTAPNGSIYQNTPENLVNIGGAVEQLGTKVVDGKTVVNPTADDAGSIAGNNIFINALSINVNGLLQSGFEEYYLDTSEFIDKIQEADELFKAGKLAKLSDDQVLQQSKDSAFCLSVGGQVFNKDKKYYDYQVPVFYNPATGTILVGEITNGGGNIYLSGIISSTGNGRIVAMDGAPDVTIRNNNDLAKDIKLYGVNTTGVNGKVTIVDTNNKTETVITRKEVSVKDLTRPKSDPTKSSIDGNYTYRPGQGLRYVWVTGQDKGTRTFYQRKKEGKWWGLSDPKVVVKEIDEATKMSEKELKSDDKGNVAAIEKDLDTREYYTISQTKQEGDPVPSTPTVTKWETGLYGFTKHELYEWYVDKTETITTKNSVNASKDIAIKFIGDGSTVSTISVNSKGCVDVHGSIGSNTLDSIVQITSTNGSIDQDRGAIKSSNVSLTAAGSMNGINITSGDLLNLTALNTANANTTYYHSGVGTKKSDGNDITIKTETRTYNGTTLLNGTTGNTNNAYVDSFTLNSNSNIEQKSGGLISAAKITLNTDNGAIGEQRAVRVNTADAPLKSSDPLSASLNAQAHGNITLEETTGDLRIGTIYSDNGDVTLSGSGNLVDALPYDAIVSSGKNEEALIQLWTELGILDDSETVKVAKAVKDSDGRVIYEYQTEDNGLPVYEEIKNADGTKSYRQLKDKNNNPLFYVLADAETLQWDARKIIYGISDAIINPQSGLKPSDKVANIKANNITLNMKDSAGLNSDKITEYKISELGMSSDLADLKLLSKSDASSIKWDAANDKVTVHQKLPIGIYLNQEGGKLNINAGQNGGTVSGNAFIEGRKIGSVVNSMNITVDKIAAKGNILLNNSMGGIYAANANSAIKGVDLTINAGAENGPAVYLGTKDTPVNVDISGLLHTTSTGEINIHQVSKTNDLVIASASAGGDITFTSEKGIMGHDSLAKEGTSRGYIRLENNGTTLKLVANNGNIGNATDGRVNVLNVADKKAGQEEDTRKIIVEAHHTDGGKHADDGSVYIYGNQNPTTEPDPAGTLKIDSITVGQKGTIDLDSLGSIYAIGENLQADKVKLRAALDVTVTAKNLELKNVDISAGKHESAESTELFDYGGNVVITGESVAIGSSGSTISATALKIINESSRKARNTDVTLSKGNVTITATSTSLTNGATIIADQNIALSANTTADNSGTMTAGNDASINAYEIITNSGAITATAGNATIHSTNGSVTNNETATINAGNNISLTASSNVNNKAVLNAGKDATINAVDNITNSGAITANGGKVDIISTLGSITNTATADLEAKAGNVTLKSEGTLNNKGDVKASQNVVLESDADIVNEGVLTAGRNASIKAYDKITNSGAITATAGNVDFVSIKSSITNNETATINAGNNVSIIASSNVTNKAALNAVKGYVVVTSNMEDVTNSGNIIAGQNIQLEANDSTLLAKVTNSGILNAGKDATINAYSDITNSGAITANGGKVDIISFLGSLTNTATADLEAKAGNVTLQSKGVLNNKGDAKASQNVVLKSRDSSVVNTAGLTATAGSASIDAHTNAKNTGKLEAGTNATITAGTTANNSGKMIAGQDATINATSNITNSGAMTADGGNASITSTQGTVVNATTGTMTARNDASINAYSNITNSGAMTAGGKVDIISTNGSITNTATADLEAKSGNVTLQSKGALENKGDAKAFNDVVLNSATSSVANAGNLNANNDVKIDAKTDARNSGTINATIGNASIEADESVNNSGAMTAGKLASISAGTSATNTATMNAGTNASITAGTTANNSGKMIAGQDATINATSNITNSGAMTADGGNASITSTQGTVVNATTGTMTASQNATINAYSNITNSGAMTANGGKVDIISTSGFITNTDTADLEAKAGNVTLQSKKELDNKGDAKASENVVLKSIESSIANAGNLTATIGSASIEAHTTANNTGKMEAGTNVTITAVEDITNKGNLIATNGNAVITSSVKGVTNSGTLSAGSNATINAKNNITNSGAMTANGSASITSIQGTVVNATTGTMTAGINASITAGTTANNSGKMTAGKDATINATSNITNSGAMTANGGKVDIISANGSITNTATADLEAKAGNVTLQSKGTLENKGDAKASENVVLKSKESNIANAGNLTATTGSASIDAHTNANNTGKLAANINATITAVEDITNKGNLIATNGNAVITSSVKGVNNSGTMSAGSNAAINAISNINNSGAMTANGGYASVSSTQGSIENTASVYAVDYVDIDAFEDVDNSGSATAGTYTSINAGDAITNSGNMNAGTFASINAGEGIINSGNMVANTYASISAVEAVTNSGTMTANEGNVTITSTNSGITNTETADLLAKKGNVTLHSKGTLDNAGAIEAMLGTISLEAGYDPSEEDKDDQANAIIINTGDVLANGNVSLKAYGHDLAGGVFAVSNTGNIESNGNVTMNALHGSVVNVGAIDGYSEDSTSKPQSVAITANDNIYNGRNVSDIDTTVEAGVVTMNATNGSVNNYMNVHSTVGNTSITAGDSIINRGYLVSDNAKDVLTAGNFIENYGHVVAQTDADVTAGTYIKNEGNMSAVHDATITAGTNTQSNIEKFIENTGTISAINNASITAKGDITNSGAMLATEGTASITSQNGSVNNAASGYMTSGGNATISAGNSITNNGSLTSTTNGNVAVNAVNDIVNAGMLVAQNGSVDIEAQQGSIYNKDGADLLAGNGNVRIETKAGVGETKASIINEGDLAANGNITLKSANGDIYNRDDFKDYNGTTISTGNVNIYAPNGEVNNTQDIYAGGTVQITAKTGLSNFAYDIFAMNSVKNADGSLPTNAITLTTKEKVLSNRSQLIAEKGDIVLNAATETVDPDTGEPIVTGGSVLNLSTGDILALGGNVVINAGATKSENRELKVVDDLNNLVPVGTTVVLNQDTTITRPDGSQVTYSKGEKVDLNTLLESTKDYAEFEAEFGTQDMVVLTEHDYGTNTTKIYYLDAEYFQAAKENPQSNVFTGDTGKKLLAEVQGSIDVYREGDVLNRGNIVALGNQVTEQPDGTYSGPIGTDGKPVGGNITINTAHGNLSNYDMLDNVYNLDTFTTSDGKKYQLAEGNIIHTAPEGYYYNNEQLESGRDLYIQGNDSVTIGDADDQHISAGGNLYVISTNGIVTNKGGYDLTAGGNITLEGKAGVINEGTVVAGEGVNVYSETGNVLLSGSDLNDKHKGDITAKGGLVRIWADNGNVVADNNTITAQNGSVDIGSTNGNTSVDKVVASEMAAVGSKGGNVDANYVKGAEIAFYNGSKDGKTNVDKITVSDFLVVQSNGIKIGEIERDKDGYLYIDATGAGGGTIKDDFNLKVEGNVWFTALSVNNANVAVTGDLAIDKLRVAGKGDFYAHNYMTTVYGKEPAYNGAEAIYYDKGEGRGNPSGIDLEKLIVESDESEQTKRDDKQAVIDDLEQLLEKKKKNSGTFNKGDNDGWMNLFIDDAHNQRSNGTLLYNSDYHYVHNQRYSAESLSKKLADYKALDSYELSFTNPFVLFHRYDLYELDNTSFNGNVSDGYNLLSEKDLMASKQN